MSEIKNTKNAAVNVGGLSFSDEEIAFLKEGGSLSGTISGGVGPVGQPQSFSATTRVDVTAPADKGVRPQVGGHTKGGDKITRLSSGFASRLATAAQKERARADKEHSQHLKDVASLQPEAMAKQIAYLSRKVKSLEKAMKELSGQQVP